MKLDRNTVLGIVILGLLFFGLFYYNNQDQARLQAANQIKFREKFVLDSTKRSADSLALAARLAKTPDTTAAAPRQSAADSAGFLTALGGTEATTEVNTDLLHIIFTNRGGQPKTVELKKFKGPDSSYVKLASSAFDRVGYKLLAAANRTVPSDSLYFNPPQVTTTPTGTTQIEYKLTSAEGQQVIHQFTVQPGNYFVDFNIIINGVTKVLGANLLNLTWQAKAVQQQRDIEYERGQSKIGYCTAGDFESEMTVGGGSKELKSNVNWVAVKQQFFNTTLVAKNNFTSGNIIWTSPDSAGTVTEAVANMQVPMATDKATAALGFYYGPNDYQTLKQYNNDMESLVDLGSGIFAFVKYINRWIVIPAFNFFSKLVSNYGIAILLLTLFIRLLISPLTYTSYLSGAKMKVLKPEIDKLKAKHGADQQAMSVDQMKLFREAGVNPLGGCIPALFQIPIFFALYSFFNSNVGLRGQKFLWATDLSQYDSILDLPFTIPLYGDHVSLFTITAVATSFLISVYSMSMTPDQNNPVLKYMPYFFPIVLLFVFNKLPAGLTWYYTVSNLITLGLQFVIQNYIINHDAILAKMEAARKKPKSKSKFAEKMEQLQEQQKLAQQRKLK